MSLRLLLIVPALALVLVSCVPLPAEAACRIIRGGTEICDNDDGTQTIDGAPTGQQGNPTATEPTPPATTPGMAAGDFVPLTNIPGIAEAAQSRDLSGLLNTIYKLCIGIAAVLAVVQILRGGLTYMLGDSVTEKREARHHIYMAVFGLLLVLSPAIVFGIIDRRILDLKINVEGLNWTPAADVTLGGGTGGQTVQERICASYDRFAYAEVPSGQSCLSVKGEGWVGLDSACCGGNNGSQTCCGFDQDLVRPPPPVGTSGDFSYDYILIDEMYDEDGDPVACSEEDTMRFTTLALCEASFNASQSQANTAVSSKCDGTALNPPQPASVWERSQDLPLCD